MWSRTKVVTQKRNKPESLQQTPSWHGTSLMSRLLQQETTPRGGSAVTTDQPGTDFTGSNSSPSLQAAPRCHTWEPTADRWDHTQRRSNHQKALAELPWPETAFQSSQQVSGGKLGLNPLATKYRLLLLNRHHWTLKEWPVTQARVPAAPVFLMHTSDEGFHQNLTKTPFAATRFKEWATVTLRDRCCLPKTPACFPKLLAQRWEATSL